MSGPQDNLQHLLEPKAGPEGDIKQCLKLWMPEPEGSIFQLLHELRLALRMVSNRTNIVFT